MYDRFLKSKEISYLRKVRQAVEEREMVIPMMCYSPDFTIPNADERQREVEKQIEMIRVTAELGGSFCRTLSGQRRNEVDDEVALGWVIDSIESCLPAAEDCGINLVIENHYKDGFWINREFAQKRELFTRIVHAIDSPHFGVQFDPSNALVAGESPIELLDEILPRLMTMHASDRYLKPGVSLDSLYDTDGTVGYMEGFIHGVTGEGSNDYDAIFERVRTVDHELWISIEDGDNGLDEMKRSVDFLKTMRQK